MSYQKHNFISKQKLTAQAMNEVEKGIVAIESEFEKKFSKLTLGYGSDGKLYIYSNKQPIGTGITFLEDETVCGTINEDNNLIFNDNIEDGAYTLYFLSSNGEYSDAMDMLVTEIVNSDNDNATASNLIPTLVDTDLVTIYNGIGYKENVRLSVSAGGEKDASGVLLTGLLPLGADGDVFYISGIANITGSNITTDYQGGYWCYDANGALLNTNSGIPAIPSSCINYDGNGNYTITMTHSTFSLLDGTAYIRFQFGLTNGEFTMTRNQPSSSTDTDTETDILGTNLLTSKIYDIKLNKRYSGSSFDYVSCSGMISFKIPMTQVLNRRIRFAGFEYGAKTTSSPPLWFTLDSNNNSLGYLTGTDSSTGIWGSAYLTQEDDGSYTLPINSKTVPVDGAVTFIVNMVVGSSTISSIPDTMSILIEEDT